MNRRCTALITGANRGIGFEVAKQLVDLGLNVVLSARYEQDAIEAAKKLCVSSKDKRDDIIGIELDVCSRDSIFAAQERLKDHFIGILINNAGVFLDDPRVIDQGNVFNLPIEILNKTLAVNLIGTLHVTQAFIPSMLKAKYGRIVNVCSGMGRWIEMDGDAPYYRLSKSSLITLTRICALSITDSNIKINAVCPGWVRTRMGGQRAIRSVEEGAKGIVFAATLPHDGPSGELLRDGKIFNWTEPKEALTQPKE